MTAVVRDGDIVARFGGDEFIVLLEDVDDDADVVVLAERLVAEVSREFVLGPHSVRIGASVGIAYCRDGYVDADRILNEADAALYRAKMGGRGRVDVFDDGLRAQLRERAEIEREATAGLDRGEFMLYYQPVVDLQTGVVDSVEALIRWNRPGHGIMLPDSFIPIAERSTLIVNIGRWVLREAADRLAAWERQEASLHRLRVAVNISGRHLVSDHLVADVVEALAHSGLEADRLILELTETVAIDNVSAISNVQALRALGVQISLDDFGTGFTSIGQLSRLPVDSIKIDRSFVASSDPSQHELVRLMVSSAHVFGLKVIAEGIEHPEQADRLRSVAAEYGQGYLFSRPEPSENIFPTLLREWRPQAVQPRS
jgi:predicted signal transduction protein with EAL and GGDEF domain